MKQHRIVVTGANGFIGTNLVNRLKDKNYKNLLAIAKNNFPGQSIKTAIGDFTDEKFLGKVLKKDDMVVHLACSTVPSSSELNREKDVMENVIGGLKLLQTCVNKKINKFIFLSSGGTIYEDTYKKSHKENEICKPVNSHGVMKLMIEEYIRIFHDYHGLDYVIIRAANPYGKRHINKKNQGIIDIFLKKIISGEPLKIWGDGSNIRDYIYIDDLTEFLIQVINTKTKNEILNAGSGKGTSLNELIKIIEKSISKKIKVHYLKDRGFDAKYSVLNIKKAKHILGWMPKTKLIDGIKKTHKYYLLKL